MSFKKVVSFMSVFGLSVMLLAGCGEAAESVQKAASDAASSELPDDVEKLAGDAAEEIMDLSSVADDMKGFADKYTDISKKLSNCISSDGSDMTDYLTKLNTIGKSIQSGALSDSQKTELDNINAEIDNLLAQSKNVCDTKLNDIIALSQAGGYTGEFEQHMNEERQKYDQLIAESRYKEAYDQLLSMEKEYNDNQ